MVTVTVTPFCYDDNVAIPPEDPAPRSAEPQPVRPSDPVVGADALTDFPC